MPGEIMKTHPIADLFPLLEGDEFNDLVQDIRVNGLLHPILRDVSGRILDGRNRERACEQLAIEPSYETWEGEDGPAVAELIIGLNVHRRHLNKTQRAILGAQSREYFNEQARQRQVEHGGTAPGQKSLKEKVPEVSGQARDQAGRAFGVSGKLIDAGTTVLRKGAPELRSAVMAGKIPIVAAAGIADLSQARQAELVQKGAEAVRKEAKHQTTQRKQANKQARAEVAARKVALPQKRFACLVIDPPWQMEKIERDERPKQVGFDYPAMSEAELRALPITTVAAKNCHLYLWTTHKHLKLALELVEEWGFTYECLMTWVKNVGFTPFSWMRSTEHVIFAKRGSLKIQRVGMRLDFAAKVREHSRKPDVFYELVREASPGPRLEMFAREEREGFEDWGNESNKFKRHGAGLELQRSVS